MQYAYTAEHEGQNTGGALAVTKGLAGKFPQHFVRGNAPSTSYGKNAPGNKIHKLCYVRQSHRPTIHEWQNYIARAETIQQFPEMHYV